MTRVQGSLLIIPGPDGTITFVRQERGPYAGSWLLPGGKREPNESLADTARREALEEVGVLVRSMSRTGCYDIQGGWRKGPYHFVMTVFLADQPSLVPDGFAGHHVGAIRQAQPNQIHPHPTDMLILNDAEVSRYPQSVIDAELARGGIIMARVLNEPDHHVGRNDNSYEWSPAGTGAR